MLQKMYKSFHKYIYAIVYKNFKFFNFNVKYLILYTIKKIFYFVF